MHPRPPQSFEVDAWITVLLAHEHLYRAWRGPAGIWTVQRTSRSRPRTLHHPVLAMDLITDVLLDVRRRTSHAGRALGPVYAEIRYGETPHGPRHEPEADR